MTDLRDHLNHEHLSDLSDVVGRMRARADNAYGDHIGQLRRDECLGWEIKVERGKFGEAELKAHCAAAEKLGRHRALHEAANMLADEIAAAQACPSCVTLTAQRDEALEQEAHYKNEVSLLQQAKFYELQQRAKLETQREALVEALEHSMLALDDWTHSYAPDHCGKDDVARARSRMTNQGGTLAYIAGVQHQNRQALNAVQQGGRKA